MKISLKNIGVHQNLELDINTTGLVLIKGSSGVGKSTILEAIEDGLYGVNKHLQPKGEKKAKYSIELDIDNLNIIRKRNPESLQIVHNNQESLEKVAQNTINNVFGSHDEFLAYCYIKQDDSLALLSLTPSKMQELIKSLVDYDLDPDKLIDISRKSIKEIEIEIVHLQGELKASTIILEDKQSQLDALTIPESVQVLPESEKQEYQEAISRIENENQELILNIEKLDQKIQENQSIKEKLNKIQSLESQFNELLNSAEYQRCITKYNNIKIPWSEKSKEQCNEYQKKLEIKSSNKKIKDEIFKLAERIYIKYPESKGNNITEWIQRRIDQNQSDIDNIYKQTEKINIQIHEREKEENEYSCPNCHIKLSFKDNALHKIAEKQDNTTQEIEELKELIVISHRNISEKQEEIKYLSDIISQSSVLKKQLTKDPLPDIPDSELHIAMNDFMEYFNTQILLEQEAEEVYKEKEKFDSLIQYYQKELSLLESNTIKSIDINQLEEKRKDLNELYRSRMDEMSKIRDILGENRLNERILLERNKAIDISQSLYRGISDIRESIQNIKDRIKHLETTAMAQKRFIDVVKSSSNQALEDIISIINTASDEFMSEFFDDTKIVINSHYTTQKNTESARISTDIYHKGNKYNKIKELSGGEKSRAVLAFCLGLSSLSKSPFILIDEGLTGLEKNDKEKCLSKIKQISSEKLVIMVEHDAPEHFFDQIIELN